MKKIVLVIGLTFLTATGIYGQSPAPGIFNYQGVARNSVGNVLINKTITLRLTIHDGSANGPVLYQESRTVTTNPFGLFNVQVGSAGAGNVTGTIAGVGLGAGAKFIQVEIDPNGGTTFISIGTASLASVPYSLYASLANDLVLPFTKTQADAGALFKITNSGTGLTLHTTGPVRLQSIGEAANRILASDAAGNATWKDPAAVNIVTGSGTVNYIPKWTPTTSNIGVSQIADNGVSVGIGTASPVASALLDVSSTTKGILAPRMTSAQRTAIASPANGLLVFDNTTNSFWFYNSAAWTEILTTSSGWSVAGNAGTNPAINFLGTTDNNDVVFKRNNTRSGFIGTSNTSFGYDALNPAGTGSFNTANGVAALGANTTGFANTANGYNALLTNTTGFFNTANGEAALLRNTTGNENTATGVAALRDNTTGSFNTATGAASLRSNTTGINNTASGYSALLSNTTGSGNTANGYQALFSNTSASNNTANGYHSLYSNTIGTNNTATGSEALNSNTTGINNTASGISTLQSNVSGSANTANGAYSLYTNSTGEKNTAVGAYSLTNNTTGNNNTAIGWTALNANTNGIDNCAMGVEALTSNTTGRSNTAGGSAALKSNISGDENTAFGKDALLLNNTGTQNTAVGVLALATNTTGIQNTALGTHTLISNITGSFNTALGDAALLNTTGSNNIGIGQFAQVPVAAGNNQIRMGNGSITYAGIQVAWTITSDRRLKSAISNSELGLDFIKSLRPVSYLRNNDDSKKTEYGFIAQEVEDALNKAGATNNGIITKDDAGMYSMRYNDLIAPMVKAIQDQQVVIEKQQERIDQLEKRLSVIEKK